MNFCYQFMLELHTSLHGHMHINFQENVFIFAGEPFWKDEAAR